MTIASGPEGLEATFAPGAGMVCCSLRHRGAELLGQRRGLAAYAQTGKTMGIPLLHPWANRLGDWSYEALGRRVSLRGLDGVVGVDGETGLPSHGTLPRPWEVAEAGAARVAASRSPSRDAFPFPHRLRYEARVDGPRLSVRLLLEPLDGPVPVCFGFHPYLAPPGAARAEFELELPVRRRLVLDDRKLPTGDTEPVEPFRGRLGDRAFDDGYDRLEDPAVFAVTAGGRRIEVAFERGFPLAQVFAPPGQDFVCFEPMTAPANALRDGGFPVATPEEPYEAAYSVSVLDALAP